MKKKPMSEELETRVRELILEGDAKRTELNELLRREEAARPIAAKVLFEEAALVSELRMDSIKQWADVLRPREVQSPQQPDPPVVIAGPWRRRAAVGAGIAAAACLLGILWIKQEENNPVPVVAANADQGRWIGWMLRIEGEGPPGPSMPLHEGQTLELGAERVRIDIENGVVLSVTGPARLRVSLKESRLWQGQVSVDVPKDLGTYMVETDNGRFVDLGTTFSVAVQPGERSEMAVHSGLVRAERISYEGDVLTEKLVRKAEGVVLEDSSGGILSVSADELNHEAPILLEDASLPVSPAYRAIVDANKPLLAWGFEEMSGKNAFANRAGPGLAGIIRGDLAMGKGAGNERHVILGNDGKSGWIEADGPWRRRDGEPFTVELWARPDRIHWGHLLNLRIQNPLDPVTGIEPQGPLSYFSMELTVAREFRLLPDRPSIRCTFRSPATEHPLKTLPGGTNAMLVSPTRYVPGRWYHLVARVEREEFTLFLDGEIVARQTIQRPDLGEQDLMIRLGSMRHRVSNNRQFVGALDEFAIYDKALSDEQVRAHYRAMVGSSE